MAANKDIIPSLKGSSQTAGDKIPLHVMIADSSGNVIETFGGSGGTSQADKTTFTSGSTQGTPAMGAYEATPTTLADGQVGVVGLTANREMKVSVTSGGTAGTQYTEGDTDTTITGTAVMFESNTGTSALGVVSSAAPLPVTLANTGANATAVKVDGSAVTQPVSGTVAVSSEYAEDAGHTSGDKGVFVLAVRQDSASTTLANANLDYAPFQVNSVGELRVVLPTSTSITSITGSMVPGTSGAQLGKAEDSAHANGDTGVFVLAVRSDTLAATSGTTGDYEAFHTDAAGALWTRDNGQLADDAAFSVASSLVQPVGYLADDTSSDSVNEGDVGAARMTLARKQITVSTADTATLTNVAASATSVTLESSNDARIGLIVHNDSTAILYLKYGATASTTSYTVKIPGDGYWEMPNPVYRGVVDGIWSSATGSARCTELT